MATDSSLVWRLDSALNGDVIKFSGKSIKTRAAAAEIAKKLNCTELEVDIQLDGRMLPLEDDIPAYSEVQVFRKVLARTKGKPLGQIQREALAKAEAKNVYGSGTSELPANFEDMTEDEQIIAMSAAASRDQAAARGRGRGGFGRGRGDGMRKGAVPPNYICHSCGKGGHYIQDCPDAQKGEAKRFSAPVGIAEAKLERVSADDPGPKYVTRDGQWVRRKLDSGALATNIPVRTENIPSEIQCTWCNGVCVEAQELPCCDAVVCGPCLDKAVNENDCTCQSCEESIVLDDVLPCDEMREKVAQWRRHGQAEKRPRE